MADNKKNLKVGYLGDEKILYKPIEKKKGKYALIDGEYIYLAEDLEDSEQ